MTPSIITIRAGTNRPIVFTVELAKVPFSAVFELVVSSSGYRKVYGEGTGLVKVLADPLVRVTWSYTLADSRAFPVGHASSTIELQWTVAGVQDSDVCTLAVLPGNSND
jgi:hypothetical protein